MQQSGDMHVFVRIVDSGSFSAAAEALGITASAVSKIITRLEDRLGVRLLHRTTRRLALTPEGEIYHLRAKDILAAITDTEHEVSGRGSAPQGRLRVNSVAPFALQYLAAALPLFMTSYPKVEVELAVTDRIVDLLADHADIAIRTGTISDSSLVVRKIGDVERGIFASPDYLKRRGTPKTPSELINHDCIKLSATPAGHRWPFYDSGEIKVIEIGSRLSVDNAAVALHLALAGAGIVRTSNLTVGNAVRDGRLVQLFTDCHVVESTPISAVYPLGRHRMLKVRAFIDFLVEHFRVPPWRDATLMETAAEGHSKARTRKNSL
jgi:DNA-binding transcriptional LysR family regulator